VSTRLQLSRDYPYGVAAFASALADPDFHRVKLDVDGSGRIEVLAFARDVDPASGAGTASVTLRQPVPPGQIPVVVERLLAGVLVIERTEEWTLGPDECSGRARVTVPGTPVGAEGTMSVTRAAEGSRLGVDLDIVAQIPLFGGGIERSVVTGIRALTGSEHDRISSWLSRAERTG